MADLDIAPQFGAELKVRRAPSSLSRLVLHGLFANKLSGWLQVCERMGMPLVSSSWPNVLITFRFLRSAAALHGLKISRNSTENEAKSRKSIAVNSVY